MRNFRESLNSESLIPEEPAVLSISEITTLIKGVLDNSFPSVWIEGEISNFKHHGSGHMYFTLKDEGAELKAVMFRGNNQFLHFRPEDGMKVIVKGGITVYAARGNYQIIIRQMQPAGLGTLYLAFNALKKKLAGEGLFDEERKIPLPQYPFCVGVITSSTGAAIQDIKNILQRRSPHIEIIVRPTLVQGNEAADDISAAISDFEEFGKADVLIIGRGGGSIEDLWPFNEEKVARAISSCTIPVISAVGHETDFTIADFVADLRAPTPSAAAELASPSSEDLLNYLNETDRRVKESTQKKIDFLWQRLDALTSRYGFQQPSVLVERKRERLNDLNQRLIQQIQFILSLNSSNFNGLNRRLISAGPKSVLSRGYSIVYSMKDQRILSRIDDIDIGDELGIIMTDGEIVAETRRKKKTNTNK